ncbi:MAG: hypothetical protein GY844_32570 [Bradyrhizobium sp.]|nr:hypothetical protein [Bradyrhizobium sp.]
MRIPEENCNMVLLATVTLAGAIVAGGVALLDASPAKQEAAGQPASIADSTPVRVIGAPFVPNTNPRERH